MLTVNHVFDIIAKYLSLGGGKDSWKPALEEAIPGRKRKIAANEVDKEELKDDESSLSSEEK